MVFRHNDIGRKLVDYSPPGSNKSVPLRGEAAVYAQFVTVQAKACCHTTPFTPAKILLLYCRILGSSSDKFTSPLSPVWVQSDKVLS
jgi:hypothetical protein